MSNPRMAALRGSPRRARSFLRTQPSRPTMGLAAQVFLDEVVLAVMQDPKLYPTDDFLHAAGREIREARLLYDRQGWISKPETYHPDPSAPRAIVSPSRGGELGYDLLTFPVDWEPHLGEPGRDRWLERPLNRAARVRVMPASRPHRPWLICVHGFGMGQPKVDLRGFRAAHLREHRNVNLAFPVLPSHGKRRPAKTNSGDGFTSSNILDGIHGIAQSIWEVRSVIRWIRAQEPEARVGVYGISLGSLVTALVASLEPGLSCAITAIPVSDLYGLYERTGTAHIHEVGLTSGAMGEDAAALARVVSPLVMTPKLARDDLYVVAGTGDRMTTPEQAERLWEHWGQPAIEWFPAGHVGFFTSKPATAFVDEALRTSLTA